MAELPLGLYEQLVTQGVERRLRLLPGEQVDRTGLDAVDAHDVLGSISRSS